MSIHLDLIESTLQQVRLGNPPISVEKAFEQLNPASLGLRMHIPAIASGTRMFRVRRLDAKPTNIGEIVEPPVGVAPIARLNDQGQSVLYMADSPDTAFAEVRAGPGEYCLAEWRTGRNSIALANGGFDNESLSTFFPGDLTSMESPQMGNEDQIVAELFATLFTINVFDEPRMYWWSIACGLANGFSHICERTEIMLDNGCKERLGRFSLSGIAYPSVRKDKKAVNFAWNDRGRSYLKLDHVQWVRREIDGSFSGLDIAASWDSNGELNWAGRAPHLLLGPGRSATMTKIAENTWSYQNHDGTLPIFG
jgi:hypothetical protein